MTEKCPKCGYCPTCGRANDPETVVYPGTASPPPPHYVTWTMPTTYTTYVGDKTGLTRYTTTTTRSAVN